MVACVLNCVIVCCIDYAIEVFDNKETDSELLDTSPSLSCCISDNDDDDSHDDDDDERVIDYYTHIWNVTDLSIGLHCP